MQGPTLASVVVLAEINDVETGQRKRSNTFHYSFELGGKINKRVVPGKSSSPSSFVSFVYSELIISLLSPLLFSTVKSHIAIAWHG